MKLYEIDAQIYALIDPETGEITDLEAWDALQIERGQKLENLALYYKDVKAEAEAIKAEEANLSERRKAAEAKAERLKTKLEQLLGGEQLKTSRVVCQYRKTQSVEVDEPFIEWAFKNATDLLTFTAPKPNKVKIREAIKAGREVFCAEIVDGVSFSIK